MSAPREKTRYPGVYKRGGRYSYRYTKPSGAPGWGSAKTLAEARAKKEAAGTDVRRGEFRTLSTVMFADYARDWIRSYAGRTARGFRETTREEYRRDLERDAIPFFERMRLSEIEPRDVKRFVAMLLDRGLAPSSVRNALAPVRACLATAVEEGLIRSGNPASGIRVPRREGVEETGADVQALTPDEATALIAAVPIEHRLFVEFLLATGLRFSEAIALRWGDIGLGRRRVLVRRRAYRGIGEPKSRYSRRDVPISTAMATRLWEQRKTVHGTDEDIVFASAFGTMLDYSNLYRRVFKPAARLAGVPWAAFHTLRHTCATFLFTREGLNAKQVQAWLGHHSAAFTLDRYVHLLPDDLPEPIGFDALGSGTKCGN